MKNKTMQAVKLIIGWPLSVIALFFLGKLLFSQSSQLSWSVVWHLNWWLLGYGIIAFLAYFFIRAYVWHKILCSFGYLMPYKETALLWAQSELRRYIPGNVWSFLSRAVVFTNRKVEKQHVSSAMLLEVELLILGSGIVSLLSLPFLYSFGLSHSWQVIDTDVILLLSVGIILLFIYQSNLMPFLKSHRWFQYVSAAFPVPITTQLLCMSVLSFLPFGLGYFLVIDSIVTLPLHLVLKLTGFFTLAYLLGYLSFITPSGLGVREGIMLIGLTKFLTSAAASLASIFSRIILIVAEVVFLGILLIWQKVHSSWLSRLEATLMKHRYLVFVWIGVIVYCLYFIPASTLRYDNYYTGRFDLGNMAQTVWNTEHGRIFQLTDPNGTDTVSRLATHADFLLILLAPFYLIWADPRMLLIIQTIIVAIGAVYVYKIGEKVVKNQPISLILAFLYLINPSVERSNLYEFHAVTLATTFLLAAFYYLTERRVLLFLISSFLAGLTKEQVWIIVGLLGLYSALFQKRWILGGSLFVFGFAMSWYLIVYAIPQALGAQHFALAYYSDFGDKPSSIVKNIILSPRKTFVIITQPDRIDYLEQILLPLGFLPLLAPLYIIFSIPELLIYLLSSNPQLHQIYYQYTAAITPFLFIAVIYGIKNIKQFFPKFSFVLIGVFLFIVGIHGAYYYGPLPGTKTANLDMFTNPLPNRQLVDSVISAIPKRYSVAASNNLGSHLSQRQNIYTIPLGIDRADYIAFLNDPTTPQLSGEQQQLIKQLKKDPRYTLIVQNGTFVVFKKKGL